MFRFGAHYASLFTRSQLESHMDKGVNVSSDIVGTLTSPVNVFQTNYAYFAGAAVIQLFAICAILLTFWGFWSLGRDFSFSPLEIGKVCPRRLLHGRQERLTKPIQAFDAPILRGLGCHLRGRDIAKIEGQHEVQYGVLKDEAIYNSQLGQLEEKISIADRARVSQPSRNRLGAWECLDLLKVRMSKRRRRSGATADEHA